MRPPRVPIALLVGLALPAHAAEVVGEAVTLTVSEAGVLMFVNPAVAVTAAGAIDALRVHFDGPFEAGVDRLVCTVVDPSVTCVWDETTAALELIGPADAATMQAVARGVAYVADGAPADPSLRTVQLVGGAVHAGVDLPGATGDHFYELVDAGGAVAWSSAASACQARAFEGLQGYLPAVTGSREQALLSTLAPAYTTTEDTAGAYWLGGTDTSVEGAWRWVTGPEAALDTDGLLFWQGGTAANGGTPGTNPYTPGGAYVSWADGEPDGALTDDDHLAMSGADGRWSDRAPLDAADPVERYLCEYGDFGSVTTVADRVASVTLSFEGCLGAEPDVSCPDRDTDGDGALNPVDANPLDPCTPASDNAACAELYDTIVTAGVVDAEYALFPEVSWVNERTIATASVIGWEPSRPDRLTCTVADPTITCTWNTATGQLTVRGPTDALQSAVRGIAWTTDDALPTTDPVHVWLVASFESTSANYYLPEHLGGQNHVYWYSPPVTSVYANAAFTCIVRGLSVTVIESERENTLLAGLIDGPPWLGVLTNAGSWEWVTAGGRRPFWTGGSAASGGAPVDGRFTAWAPGQPDLDATATNSLQLNPNGTWSDERLDALGATLCESTSDTSAYNTVVGALVDVSCLASQTNPGCPLADDDGDGVVNVDDPAPNDACDPDPDILACPTGDADGDGTPNGEDTTPEDACEPDPDVLACPTGDADGDGEPNNTDTAPEDACDPDPDVLACPTGDADGDGTPNGEDGTPEDACEPDPDVLACPTGDADGDGEPNNTDTAPEDACDPDPDVLACPTGDADGDGTPNGEDATPDDACAPDPDVLACPTGDADGDGTPNGEDGTPEDACDPDPDALACPTGDADGDGTPNGEDGTPEDACEPDPDVLACPTGDADGDGEPNDTDTAPEDACDPNPDALACPTGDADGDGTPNGDDGTPEDACDPNPDVLACPTGDADGDGLSNEDELALGLDPNDPDSDGDGINDGDDPCPDDPGTGVDGDTGLDCTPDTDVDTAVDTDVDTDVDPDEPVDEQGCQCAVGPTRGTLWWLAAFVPLIALRRRPTH